MVKVFTYLKTIQITVTVFLFSIFFPTYIIKLTNNYYIYLQFNIGQNDTKMMFSNINLL